MINIGTIYKITNPKGKVYIGQTNSLKARMSYYEGGHSKSQKRIYRSIQKYGWESHTVEILYAGPLTDEGLNQLEIHYIRIYNSFKGGLNLTEGGAGVKGVWKGRKHSEETKARMRKPKRPRKGPNGGGERIPKSEKWKASRKEKRGLRCKKILQYDHQGNVLGEWGSLTEAAEALGIYRQCISACLKGQRKSSKGFIWKYSEE
jgi:hypothetical protein